MKPRIQREPDPGLRLPEQPFQILEMLLEHEGGLVTREEMHKRLWADDTNLDFEAGINAAILSCLRHRAVNQTATDWIETVLRRGYRLLIPAQIGNEQPRATSNDAVDGESLKYVISRLSGQGHRNPPLTQLMDLATRLVEGLGEVHSSGLSSRAQKRSASTVRNESNGNFVWNLLAQQCRSQFGVEQLPTCASATTLFSSGANIELIPNILGP